MTKNTESQNTLSPGMPFSQACENNKEPILNVLKLLFTKPVTVVEIGSGTGQHSAYFSEQLPHVLWQPTDLQCNLDGIESWRVHSQQTNLKPAHALNVCDLEWPIEHVDAFFSANTTHIMSWKEVTLFMTGAGKYLPQGGHLCLYGPFKYNGSFTSESNKAFDAHLKDVDPNRGIRDFENMQTLAHELGFELVADYNMPANNQMLVWRKSLIRANVSKSASS